MVNNIYANIAIDSISHFASTPHRHHEPLFVFVLELYIQETSPLPRLLDCRELPCPAEVKARS